MRSIGDDTDSGSRVSKRCLCPFAAGNDSKDDHRALDQGLSANG